MEKEFTKGYENMSPFLRNLAERQLEIEFPTEVYNAWENLAHTMRIADHIIDTTKIDDQRRIFGISCLNYLAGIEAEITGPDIFKTKMHELQSYLKDLGTEKTSTFVRSLTRLLKVTEEIKIEKDPRKLTNLVRLEGQITGRLFLNLLPDEFVQQENYEEYARIVKRLGRTGNLFDTVVDLSTDYQNGEVLVHPSVKNRLMLMTSLLPDSAFVLKRIGHVLPAEIAGVISSTFKMRETRPDSKANLQ